MVAVEQFLDVTISQKVADEVFTSVLLSKENIVLTGMPGCGKSTIGRLLPIDGYTWVDTDAEIEKRCGCPIKELIEEKGEGYFRDLETAVIADIASNNAQIISTGGGAILREENVRALQRNGRLFFIDAPLSRLCATDDRPLSNTREKLERLYAQRMDTYRSTADVIVPERDTPQAEADYILSKRMV